MNPKRQKLTKEEKEARKLDAKRLKEEAKLAAKQTKAAEKEKARSEKAAKIFAEKLAKAEQKRETTRRTKEERAAAMAAEKCPPGEKPRKVDESVSMFAADRVFDPDNAQDVKDIKKYFQAGRIAQGLALEICEPPWYKTGWSRCDIHLLRKIDDCIVCVDLEGKIDRKRDNVDLSALRWKLTEVVETKSLRTGQKIVGEICPKENDARVDYPGSKKRFFKTQTDKLAAHFETTYTIPPGEKKQLMALKEERAVKSGEMRKENDALIKDQEARAAKEQEALDKRFAAELEQAKAEHEDAQGQFQQALEAAEKDMEFKDSSDDRRYSRRHLEADLSKQKNQLMKKIMRPVEDNLNNIERLMRQEKKRVERTLKELIKQCETRLEEYLTSNAERCKALEDKWERENTQAMEGAQTALSDRMEGDWQALKVAIMEFKNDHHLKAKMMCPRCEERIGFPHQDGMCDQCTEEVQKLALADELGLKPHWCKNQKFTPYAIYHHEMSIQMRNERPDIDLAVMNQRIKQTWRSTTDELKKNLANKLLGF